MANKVNKVIDRNGNVLIDLTNDTVSQNKVLAGTKFHGPDGKEYSGTLKPNELDILKYNFVDFDGELLYSFSDEEIDAMTSMPAGPDHTDENLTFQDWNWDLEDLKAWDRTRPDRPIVGANVITTDGKTYIYFKIVKDNSKFTFYSGFPKGFKTIDWGDGSDLQTVSTSTLQTHTYATKGDYVITLDPDLDADYSAIKWGGSDSSVPGHNTVYRVRYGKNIKLGYSTLGDAYMVEDINFPINENETSVNISSSLVMSKRIKAIILPKNITSMISSSKYNAIINISDQTGRLAKDTILSINGKLKDVKYFISGFTGKKLVIPDGITGSMFVGGYYNYLEELLYIPAGITVDELKRAKLDYLDLSRSTQTSINSNGFEYMYFVKEVILPPNITSIPGSCFSGCTCLKYIKIPANITSIGSNAFYGCIDLTIDLSEATSIIPLSGALTSLGATGGDYTYNLTILIPSALLDSYKSASYWSNFAAYMVGV